MKDIEQQLPDDLNPEVVKATAQFIGKITGLVPPPHNAFPPEWYGYLRTFTARLNEIASVNATPSAPVTQCKGTNCPSTDGQNHSPECRAEHAAAVAGGRFVKVANGNEREAFETWIGNLEGHPFAGQFANLMWKAWQARAALSASTEAAATCAHRVVDARNQIVKSGYICIDCGALFAAADHTTPPAATLSTDSVHNPVHKLTDGDVYTLIGHASLLRGEGKQDMPTWFMGLAHRIALTIGDKALADRVTIIDANEASATASDKEGA